MDAISSVGGNVRRALPFPCALEVPWAGWSCLTCAGLGVTEAPPPPPRLPFSSHGSGLLPWVCSTHTSHDHRDGRAPAGVGLCPSGASASLLSLNFQLRLEMIWLRFFNILK